MRSLIYWSHALQSFTEVPRGNALDAAALIALHDLRAGSLALTLSTLGAVLTRMARCEVTPRDVRAALRRLRASGRVELVSGRWRALGWRS